MSMEAKECDYSQFKPHLDDILFFLKDKLAKAQEAKVCSFQFDSNAFWSKTQAIYSQFKRKSRK